MNSIADIGSGVYAIANIVDGRFYIGSTANFKKRWSWHRKDLRGNRHGNKKLQAAWNEHGEQSFVFKVLKYCGLDKLLHFEQAALDHLNAVEIGYNISPTAGNCTGIFVSKETRDKQAAKKIGKAFRLGMTHTEESKAKMSATKTGKIMPEDQKVKISESMKGKVRTKEHNEKLAASKRGKPRSPETIKKMSEGQKGKKQSPETIAKRVAAIAATRAAKASANKE